MKLTASAVAALKLPVGKSDHIEWDAELRGFGFRLRPVAAGVHRSWVAQYRYGRTRRVLLGSAVVLGAEQARTAAKNTLAKVALGQDPQAERADRRTRIG